jgi:hypothetical protein
MITIRVDENKYIPALFPEGEDDIICNMFLAV